MPIRAAAPSDREIRVCRARRVALRGSLAPHASQGSMARRVCSCTSHCCRSRRTAHPGREAPRIESRRVQTRGRRRNRSTPSETRRSRRVSGGRPRRWKSPRVADVVLLHGGPIEPASARPQRTPFGGFTEARDRGDRHVADHDAAGRKRPHACTDRRRESGPRVVKRKVPRSRSRARKGAARASRAQARRRVSARFTRTARRARGASLEGTGSSEYTGARD